MKSRNYSVKSRKTMINNDVNSFNYLTALTNGVTDVCLYMANKAVVVVYTPLTTSVNNNKQRTHVYI